MSLTIDQLYAVVQQIGIDRAVASGAFHNLPYSSGGDVDPTSNVRMVSAAVTANGPPGAGGGHATLGFSPALTATPFLSATVLNPTSSDYAYAVNLFPDEFTGVFISVIATWQGDGDDPLTAYPVNVGIRAEPFVAS